jgi:hypothetical protein
MPRESITSSANTGVAKRRAATYYGRRLHERQALAVYSGEDGKTVYETTFNFQQLADFTTGDKLYNFLPAGHKVLSAQLIILTPWVGGTSLTVGTYNVTTGAVVSANSLVTATEAAVANLVANKFINGAGALVGGDGLAANYNIKAVAAGTFTAGEATLRIEMQAPIDRFSVLNG